MPKRTDKNHKQILDFCRSIEGVTVFSTHDIGKGFPDMVMGYNGINYLVEIKDGDKPPSQRKLTEAEVVFHKKWAGTVYVVNNTEDILKILDVKK